MLYRTQLTRCMILSCVILLMNLVLSAVPTSSMSTRAQDLDQTTPVTYTIFLPAVENQGQAVDATDAISYPNPTDTDATISPEIENDDTAQPAPISAADVLDWVVAGSNIYYTGGNVGIGITTPTASLDVRRATNGVTARFAKSNGGADIRIISAQDGTSGIGGFSVDNFHIYEQGQRRLSIVDGNVGIGVLAPTASLDVRRSTNGVSARFTKSNGYGDVRVISAQDGTTGIGGFSVDNFSLYEQGQRRITIASGDVGIGTGFPQAKLDVNGSLKVNGPVQVKAQTITLTNVGRGCHTTGVYGFVYKIGWDPGGQGNEGTEINILSPFDSLVDTGTGGEGYQEVGNPIRICISGSKAFVDSITLFYMPFAPF